ncbi:MAG: FliA/WhiG family RNA polymerase sigma factor [Pseudomonadota bacterium]|nr:FliA/WhiG family RNA polymerase sigma factor [Pseudomonadota bacterium]
MNSEPVSSYERSNERPQAFGGAFRVASSSATLPAAPTREQQIAENYPLVRTIAARMAQRLPGNVDLDELTHMGTLGLIDAVDRYDAARGVPLRAYAEIRIRGAIVDGLRDADWTPRAVRRNTARIDEVRAQLRRRLGRDPAREEMAQALEVAPREYDRLRADNEIRRLVSLDAPPADDAQGSLLDRLEGDSASPLDRWVAAEKFAALHAAIEALPEREREVVTAYYQGGQSLKQIGARLGVTESRICQIHGQAVKRLQRVLGADADE